MAYRFLYLSAGATLLVFSAISPADSAQPPSCSPSETHQAWLERVNQARSQPRQCGDESFQAVESLTWSCALEAAAKDYAKNMAENDFFSHTSPSGKDVGERVRDQGYDWWAVGENIAAGQDSIEAVIEGWLSSPGHCANLMSEKFSEMGMARAQAPGSAYSPYWTQIFARPK